MDPKFRVKIRDALNKDSMKFAVVMDDKTLIIELPWDKIRESTEVSISAYIVALMREERTNA